MSCATKHPDQPGVVCMLTSVTHPQHLAVVIADDLSRTNIVWTNEEYRSAEELRDQQHETRRKITEMADEARKVIPSEPKKRKGDPNNVKTALGKVANYLANHTNEWIPGRRFSDSTYADGGAEGLRRLRQLRDDFGWVIEERPDPDPRTNVSLYRCTYIPPEYIRS